MIGHNNGPTLESGASWRRHAWSKARAALLPTLPIEVLRLRVKRAEELGLPYRTYASVRASTGRDVIGFLFSSNALRVTRVGQAVPGAVADRLDALRDVSRGALCYPGIGPLQAALEFERAAPAPWDSWSEVRRQLKQVLRDQGLPSDGVLIVGETAAEREWCAAAEAAGYLSGGAFLSGAEATAP